MTWTLITKIGPPQVVRVTESDFDSVYKIGCEAAEWLASRGIDMWKWMPTETGRKITLERIRHHDVYAVKQDDRAVATLCLMWNDRDVWGERGEDGAAGYVHGLALRRCVAGTDVAMRLLEWTGERIAESGRRLLRLDCMGENTKLRACYERLGFTCIGIKQGNGWSAAMYEKEVGR